jgi:hypothetical protein
MGDDARACPLRCQVCQTLQAALERLRDVRCQGTAAGTQSPAKTQALPCSAGTSVRLACPDGLAQEPSAHSPVPGHHGDPPGQSSRCENEAWVFISTSP